MREQNIAKPTNRLKTKFNNIKYTNNGLQKLELKEQTSIGWTNQSACRKLKKGSGQQSAINNLKGSLKSYSDRNVKVQGTKALRYIAVSQIPNYQTRFPKAKRYRTSIRVGIHRMRGGGKTNSEVEVRDEYGTAHGGKFIPPE